MSTEKTQKGIGARLRYAIKTRGESFRAFSERTGIPYRSLQQYLGEERLPGADVLIRMAVRGGIDLHFLLLGEGSPSRGPRGTAGLFAGVTDGPTPTYGAPPTSPPSLGHPSAHDLETAMLSEVVDTLASIGLGPIVLGARRGTLLPRLRILLALDRAYPDTLSMDDLVREAAAPGARLDLRDVAADLGILVRAGKAEEVTDASSPGAPPRYRAKEPHTRLQVHGVPDRCQHLLEALRVLARTVLPHLEADDGLGKLVTGELRLPEDQVGAFLVELVALVEQFVQRSAQARGEVPVSLVLAAGATEPESDQT